VQTGPPEQGRRRGQTDRIAARSDRARLSRFQGRWGRHCTLACHAREAWSFRTAGVARDARRSSQPPLSGASRYPFRFRADWRSSRRALAPKRHPQDPVLLGSGQCRSPDDRGGGASSARDSFRSEGPASHPTPQPGPRLLPGCLKRRPSSAPALCQARPSPGGNQPRNVVFGLRKTPRWQVLWPRRRSGPAGFADMAGLL